MKACEADKKTREAQKDIVAKLIIEACEKGYFSLRVDILNPKVEAYFVELGYSVNPLGDGSMLISWDQ